MTKVCAYCNIEGRLTREHIWPSCIIERLPDQTARYSSRAKRVFAGDLTISDVCAECNNGPLADLDAYICKLFDRWFVHYPERGQWLDFDYDWSLLGRWLLKISYNSSRAAGTDHEILKRHSSFMIGTDFRQPDLAVWLDLVEPTYYEESLESGLVSITRTRPSMTRCCNMTLPHVSTPNYIVRLVAINSFYFYMAVPKIPYGPVFDDLSHIVEYFSLMACLSPDATVCRAKTTGLSVDLMIRPHLEENEHLYEEFDKAKNRRNNPMDRSGGSAAS